MVWKLILKGFKLITLSPYCYIVLMLHSESDEAEIINNHKTNMLYSHDFGQGRFFQVVHEDKQGFEIKLASKTMLKAVYIYNQDDIEGIEFIKVVEGRKELQKLKLSKFNLAQLKAFLSLISQINLKGITEKRLKLYDEDGLDEGTIKTLRTLLSKKGGADVIEAIINEGLITSRDIVNTGFRKRGLAIFENLLNDKEYWKMYASENNISTSKEEPVLQYFFKKNEWIFGYGLDYRYQMILQKEAFVSNSDIDGSSSVIADYLLGDKRFTTFVELKKPTTPLFGKNKNRSNSWTLSDELMASVSQILEQKASGLIRLESGGFNTEGNRINQKPYDSKVILIIGNWAELNSIQSEKEREVKKKTLELFRRDSRNIEILTYDELLDRAQFIVK